MKDSSPLEDPHSQRMKTKEELAGSTIQRESTPGRFSRHHICSGCGVVRSAKYHEKHPIASQEKPVFNYCRQCLEKSLASGQPKKHHFCFDCGKVRSKSFQKSHPTKDAEDVLPNYCGQCVADAAIASHIPDSSTVVSPSAIVSGKTSPDRF
jgi:ribosomal protein L32